ncbi:MAG: UDP-2,3-diacylglucosamine diphosphatase [Dysgonamonadaceae bacterium]|jgi:UDP-2,3-diacylglucosamine hydrolase|nr:UDP-2,3-diacylglucosamine diphosphatase [Dysgonamonadaceae bacterium]
MARENVYFVSDLHLGSDLLEPPQTTEKRFVRWLDTIRDDARALYLLGDIFDFWFEYKRTVPRGFTRFLGKIAELHDAGVEIHFFTGNHDIWMFDYFQQELGVAVHTRPLRTLIDGKSFYLAHGDGLGDRSRSFRLIRFLFRNPVCQFLFACIPSRWGIRFGCWWSRCSRKKGIAHPVGYQGEEKEHLVLFSKQYLREHPDTDYLIFGHRHILLDFMLSRKSRMLIIGDWMSYFSYAVFDGQALKLEQYNAD